MPILNYTTEVAAEKTVAEIQRILAKAGAQHVGIEYDRGEPKAVAFTVRTPYGLRQFALPCNDDRVYKVMLRDHTPPRYRNREQATRVAWRIVKDWLEAMLAIIASEMVTLDQLMLPYMQTPAGHTVYEAFVMNQPQLEAGGRDGQ
jgi:hypothetical protein